MSIKKFKEALDTLELNKDSSYSEVFLSYKDLIRIWHPDRYSHDLKLMERASIKTQELNNAYEYLKGIGQIQFDSLKDTLFNEYSKNSTSEKNQVESEIKEKHNEVRYSRSLFLLIPLVILIVFLVNLKYENKQIARVEGIINQQYKSLKNVSGNVRTSFQLFGVCPEMKAGELELSEIIKIFLLPDDEPATMGAWETGADPKLGIVWVTDGVITSDLEGYVRVGLASVLINGQKLTQVLRNTMKDCLHYIHLKGARGGYSAVNIENSQFEKINFHPIEYLKSSGFKVEHFLCDKEIKANNVVVFKIKISGKKDAWAKIGSSTGSGGVSHDITLILDEFSARKVDCEF